MPELNLRYYLTPASVARTISVVPPLLQPIRTTVYANAQTHPLPLIGLDQIMQTISNVPVVRRGTQAVVMNSGSNEIIFIEPQGIDVSTFVSASEMNNWRVLSNQSIQQMVDAKIAAQQLTVRKTTEALCAQSLTGAISYPMKVDGGGTDTYEIDYGSTLSFTPAAKWDAGTTTVEMIYLDLVAMDALIQGQGWGGQLVSFVGSATFSAVIQKANANSENNAIKVRITENAVYIGNYQIRLTVGSYKNASGQAVPEIPADGVCMVDLAAPHALWYLSIDDLEAGLVALPYFASPEYKRNPSGADILGRSKPLPAPVVKAICWATVTD